jgi:hypothetical protein
MDAADSENIELRNQCVGRGQGRGGPWAERYRAAHSLKSRDSAQEVHVF